MIVQYQFRPTWRRNIARATDSMRHLPIAGNIPNRQFNPEAVNLALGGRAGRRYHLYPHSQWLAVPGGGIGIYWRRIAGRYHRHARRARLLALQVAIAQRHARLDLVLHSDRALNMPARPITRALDRHGLMMSMRCQGALGAMR
jgi:hypothetical protein